MPLDAQGKNRPSAPPPPPPKKAPVIGSAGAGIEVKQGGRFATDPSTREYDYSSRDAEGNVVGASKGVPFSYNTRPSAGSIPGDPNSQVSRAISISLNENLSLSDRPPQNQAPGYYPGISSYEGIPKNVPSAKLNQTTGKKRSYSVNLSEGLSVSSGPPNQVPVEPTKTSGKQIKSNVAAFTLGSKSIAQNPTFQNIIKSSNISLKGIAANAKTKEIDPNRELNPLGNRADLIETVQRPVINLGKYIAAGPAAIKKIIETGDPLAGEKYYKEKVEPTLKPTASSRLFSNPSELFEIKKLPENLISASTEIAMYAFMGGGKLGKSPKPPKTSLIETTSNLPYVPKNTYRVRPLPRDIFKADKAEPIQFTRTNINLGKGIGLKFDPSSSGITSGRPPTGRKPPSTFTSTKTELGQGMGKPPTSEIKTKSGQILLVKPKFVKQIQKQKQEQPFKQTTVKLGEAEAKVVKQIQKQQQKPITTTTKKKKPTLQSSAYFIQEETMRYPPNSSFKSEFDTKQKQQQSFFITPMAKQKQQQSFFITPMAKQKQQQSFFITPMAKQKQNSTFKQSPKLATKLDMPIVPQQTFFTPQPPKTQTIPKPPRFPFPPYIPGAYFGSSGYENPASLKKAFAAYGISSDINIKTLPTYSRYSEGSNIFKEQAKEDVKIQNIFYGKPRKKSKSKKKSNYKKSRKK